MSSGPVSRTPAGPDRQPDFAAVFDASPRPLLLVKADDQYTMVAVNQAHAQAFGTTQQALLGRGVFEVFPTDPTPEVAEFAKAIRASFNEVLTTGAPHHMDVRQFAVTADDGEAQSRYWQAVNVPMSDDAGRVAYILSAVQDVTGEVLEKRSQEIQRLLMREVDHRSRNVLSVVQSFLRLTAKTDVDTYKEAVEGRVEALARSQTSLAERQWQGADLRELVEAEVLAIAPEPRFEVSGPAVLLEPNQVQAVTMIVHELATNAAKYGALCQDGGRVSVAWEETAGHVTLNWREAGGPEVHAPTRNGFGSRLIAQLGRQLGGTVAYDWLASGLAVRIQWDSAGEPPSELL